jgi:hypothetical protein
MSSIIELHHMNLLDKGIIEKDIDLVIGYGMIGGIMDKESYG